MNFDTPTSPLRVSMDVIATIIFASLGHWTTYLSLESNSRPMSVQRGRYIRESRERAELRNTIALAGLSELIDVRQNAVDALPGIGQGIFLSWCQTSQSGSRQNGQI